MNPYAMLAAGTRISSASSLAPSVSFNPGISLYSLPRFCPQTSTLLLRIQPQARRLWHLSNTCSFLLTTLLEKRFLKRTASGTHLRATSTNSKIDRL
jgi:hypothetical protein